MLTSIARVVAAGALALGAGLVTAPPASADPATDFPLTLTCDDGSTWEVSVAGNGSWTPAHDLQSNSILVPTEFGEFQIVVTDLEGNVLEEITEPPATKGSGQVPPGATELSCTFEIEFQEVDEASGQEIIVTVSGSVDVFVTPAD